jgi:hypothetical protein
MTSAIDREALADEPERHVKEEGEILQEYRTLATRWRKGG